MYEGNEEHHNCIECKNEKDYYHFPSESDYNCYTTQEMTAKGINWYFDEVNKVFGECDSNCETCIGPTNENCTSCKDNKYLYKGKCLESCPVKTFETQNTVGKKNCVDCFENCENCSKLGNSSYMMCDSCPEDNIIYKYDYNAQSYYNCYKISNNTIKSFFVPESNDVISSCFQLFNKYIIENTNECIDKPEESTQNQNYFISNEQTGLLSSCHSSCLNCSQSPINSNPNCDLCKDGYGLQKNGNCVTNCGEGYYENNNKCLKCHNNCKTCSTGMITDINGRLINMKCSECKEDMQEQNLLRYLSGENNADNDINQPIKMIKNEENCFPIIFYNDSQIIFNIS